MRSVPNILSNWENVCILYPGIKKKKMTWFQASDLTLLSSLFCSESLRVKLSQARASNTSKSDLHTCPYRFEDRMRPIWIWIWRQTTITGWDILQKNRILWEKNMTKWYTIELGTLDVTFSSIDTFSTWTTFQRFPRSFATVGSLSSVHQWPSTKNL